MTIAIVRPWWGDNVNGDMAGDYGTTDAPDQVLPDCTLIYAASVLAENGHDVAVLDNNAEHMGSRDLLRKVVELHPEQIFVKVAAPTCTKDLQFAESIRPEVPKSRVYVFGACMTSLAQEVLQRYQVDGVVMGDPNRVVVELLRGCENGLWTRYHNSAASYATYTLETLNELPSARYDLTRYQLYRRRDVSPFAFTTTSLGCPNDCPHCPYASVYGAAWRAKSAIRVVEELAALSLLGIRYVQFRDMVFTFDQQRVADISDRLVAEGIDVRWACETRVEMLTETLVQKMARAGCYQIDFGVESGSASIREVLGRRSCSEARAQLAVKWMRDNGIAPYAFFMVGLPGESEQTVQSTIDAALALGCDCRCSPLYLYPNTQLRRSLCGNTVVPLDMLETYDYVRAASAACDLTVEEITAAKTRFERMIKGAGLSLFPQVPSDARRR